MKRSPELTPTRHDALVAAAVLLLAALLGARMWFAPARADAAVVVVSADGAELERFPLGDTTRDYANNGYTVTVAATAAGVRVERADCPTQDCVRTGTITRAGQSIVCLPARIVVTLEGADGADFDAIAG